MPRIADVAEGLQRIARYEEHDSRAIYVRILTAGTNASHPDQMDALDVERLEYLGFRWDDTDGTWYFRH